MLRKRAQGLSGSRWFRQWTQICVGWIPPTQNFDDLRPYQAVRTAIISAPAWRQRAELLASQKCLPAVQRRALRIVRRGQDDHGASRSYLESENN